MANQHVNKVAVNGKTVLDLSADTVYPGMLAKGITAHDKSGAKITGTLEVPAAEERTVELSMPSGNQVIQPTSGKVMSKVTVQKPDTLLPENIKKGVVIGGVTGALEASSSGGTKEMWVLIECETFAPYSGAVQFTSNDTLFYGLTASYVALVYWLDAEGNEVTTISEDNEETVVFVNQAYRKLTFDTPPTGDLLAWLQAHGLKV